MYFVSIMDLFIFIFVDILYTVSPHKLRFLEKI